MRRLFLSRKLQSFLVMKFNSTRLKEYNYDITITLEDARKNGEVIRLGDSQLLSVIRKIKNIVFDQERLIQLEKEEKKLRRRSASKENSKILSSLREEIDKILFIPEVISLKVENKKHYERIIESGLFINGKKYVRLMSGAGNLRRNTVLLIDEEYFRVVRNVLDNGRDKTIKLNPGKFIAYDGLFNSSGHRVSFPNFCVVPDFQYKRMARMNWINPDDSVEEIEKEIVLNCFDGQGLISPNLARKWAKELEISYIPSTFIIRAPYLKGQVVTFDFHEYCRVHTKHMVTDIYGESVDIRFVDLVLSESQFKLKSSYESVFDFVRNCHQNDLGFYVSRVSYWEPKHHVWSNYMFMQVLSLSDEEIESLCKDTVEYFESLLGGDYRKMILYLGGDTFSHFYKEDWFEKIDIVTKALIINPKLAIDPYVVYRFNNNLSKQIRDSYMGKLLFEGNFSPLVADPYMQCDSLFFDDPESLLSEDGHYYKFWRDRYKSLVASCRSPLTHQSEMTLSVIENSQDMEYWYKYQDTSFIYNPKSLDTLYWADSDVDGDLISTFSSPEIINGKQEGLPISYDKKVAQEVILNESELWETDVDGFNSKVGFYTNIATTYHALLSHIEEYPKKKEIQNRLIKLRRAQGEAIDSTKNASSFWPVPEFWTKWRKPKSSNDKSTIFNNSIIADKRPVFMRYLYSAYERRFKLEQESFDILSWFRFGQSFSELLAKENKTKKEQGFIDYFISRSFFIHSDSIMNRISKHMQSSISDVKTSIYKLSKEFDYKILFSKDFDGNKVSKESLDKMLRLFRKYNSLKAAIKHGGDTKIYKNIDQIISVIRKEAYSEISSNGSFLANLAIIVCYGIMRTSTRSFLWSVFGDELIENLLSRRESLGVEIPVPSPYGFEYLYSKYEMKTVDINV